MRKYVTRSEAVAELWYGQPSDFVARNVYERDPSPIATGLYDASGTKIFRVDEMEPIGFQRLKEKP